MNENLFSPWYDPNKPAEETGIYHNWERIEFGPYYGPAYECSKCERRNVGWRLWKEDKLPTCQPIEPSVKNCEWPSCQEEALCRSGNFGDKLVCREHFGVTNGEATIELTWNEIGQLIEIGRKIDENRHSRRSKI